MDLIAFAAPFFVLATLVELAADKVRGTRYYRANDAINSLSTGILMLTSGFFTKLLSLIIWGLVLQHLAIFEMPMAWFDTTIPGLMLWIVAAIAWDFCYYWNHRLNHEISVLWAAHSVHHQSEDYNLSTAQRQTSTGFLFGWIFYVPLFVLGFPIEVVVTVGALNLIYQFWVHTRFVGRLGVLDRILVTPSNHRVHHAQNERYIDKNYGGIFILWDRLFGSFADEDDDEPVVFGVRKPLANWNPVWANFQVYGYLLHDAIRTRRWRDKIGVWFRRTGWRPPDVAAAYPKTPADIETFEKYDPPVSRAMRAYVLFQFVAAVLLTLVILQLADAGLAVLLPPCVLLWTQLYTIGLLSEGRAGAVRLEVLRLVLLNGLALLLLPYYAMTLTSQALFVYILYLLVSAISLLAINEKTKTLEASENIIKQ
jgi:sterol desaturase/sphingolipid hydroxylase (fatty acid hydroxylase superfamily)